MVWERLEHRKHTDTLTMKSDEVLRTASPWLSGRKLLSQKHRINFKKYVNLKNIQALGSLEKSFSGEDLG